MWQKFQSPPWLFLIWVIIFNLKIGVPLNSNQPSAVSCVINCSNLVLFIFTFFKTSLCGVKHLLIPSFVLGLINTFKQRRSLPDYLFRQWFFAFAGLLTNLSLDLREFRVIKILGLFKVAKLTVHSERISLLVPGVFIKVLIYSWHMEICRHLLRIEIDYRGDSSILRLLENILGRRRMVSIISWIVSFNKRLVDFTMGRIKIVNALESDLRILRAQKLLSWWVIVIFHRAYFRLNSS